MTYANETTALDIAKGKTDKIESRFKKDVTQEDDHCT